MTDPIKINDIPVAATASGASKLLGLSEDGALAQLFEFETLFEFLVGKDVADVAEALQPLLLSAGLPTYLIPNVTSGVDGTTDLNTLEGLGFQSKLYGITNPNLPAASSYFYIYNIRFGVSASSNMTQIAIPYSNTTSLGKSLFYRGRFSGAWSPWERLLTDSIASTLFSALGHGHAIGDVAGLQGTLNGLAPLAAPNLTGNARVDGSPIRTIASTPAMSNAEAVAGTSTAERVMTAVRLKEAILAHAVTGLGAGQSWQDVKASRAGATSYQNTTGKPISVMVQYAGTVNFQISANGSTWVTVGDRGDIPASAVVPNNHYYRLNGTPSSIWFWAELR